MDRTSWKLLLMNSRTGGSAMIYAVFTMAVVTAFSTLIVSLNFYRNFSNKRVLALHRSMIQADNGIQLMLAGPSIPGYNNTVKMPLFAGQGDSVMLRREQWGLYDLLISGISNRADSIYRMVLAGNLTVSEMPAALYVAASVIPLSVAGNTTINGLAQVPGGSISMNSGAPFSGSLSSCTMQESSGFPLPDASWEKLRSVSIAEAIMKLKPLSNTAAIQDTISNSFRNEGIRISGNEALLLEHVKLTGKIAIVSSRKIVVSRTAQLSDVILAAPTVILEDGVNGSMQVIATDSIITGSNCTLRYPSVLSIYADNSGDRGALIQLGRQSSLNGIALCIAECNPLNRSFMIKLETGSTVSGQVICNDVVQSCGRVNGTLHTKRTLALLPSGFGENVLLNTIIDLEAMSEDYCGISIFNKTRRQHIVKCLH